MQIAPLEIGGFVYWLYAFIDFATLWKEPWFESQQWQVWNSQWERCQIKAILLATKKELKAAQLCKMHENRQNTGKSKGKNITQQK